MHSLITTQHLQLEENPWETTGTEVVYTNNWIDVNHNSVINPAGNNGIYGVVHFKNIAVAILPIDNEGFIYIVGQYRYPLNEYSWELPMGGSPIGENPVEGAKRELLEETGLVAKKWTEIGKIHPSNCVSDEIGFVYLAENLTQKTPIPEETELLVIKRISLKELVQMAENGEVTDGISLFAIYKIARLLGI